MVRMCLHLFILIVLFVSLSCPAIVQAGDWVERSDAPYAGGYGEDALYMFNWFDKSNLSTHIVINEIEQNPYGTDAGNEWVELYNPTTSDVNLDGWKLSTMHGKTVTVTLCGTIPANGYFVYTHTEQWLDNEIESVILRDPSLNGIDRTPYVPDTNSTRYSWQRYPNGKDTDSDSDWEFRASTEGRSNGELPPPPKTIYIDDDFVDDPPNHKWDTIQEGINDANSGDTIIVSDGTYNENVDVDKRLTIRSENGADVTIVRSASSSDHVFEVTANRVNITGFTVTGATCPGASPGLGLSGIRLSYACYCNISNNNASNNDCGIYLYYSSSNTLTNNNANSNNWLGIHLSFSSNNTLRSNTASNNDIIHIETAVMGNNYNSGICLYFSSDNTLTNNNANSNNYNSGIYLRFSSDNTLRSNTASNNNYGIYMFVSGNNNTLTNNTASNNSNCGIYLYSSSNNTLENNTAMDSNTYDGIALSSSSNNTLKNNNASDNSRIGIGMWDSSNNTIYHNNLINNTNSNAYDNGINTWDNDYPSGGNYYSDYNGTDTDTDTNGIGDTTHPIPGGRSVDYFPLMQPWNGDMPQKGDLNGDGQITAADAAIALRMAVSGERDDDADMNMDGRVSSVDALIIMQAAAACIVIG